MRPNRRVKTSHVSGEEKTGGNNRYQEASSQKSSCRGGPKRSSLKIERGGRGVISQKKNGIGTEVRGVHSKRKWEVILRKTNKACHNVSRRHRQTPWLKGDEPGLLAQPEILPGKKKKRFLKEKKMEGDLGHQILPKKVRSDIGLCLGPREGPNGACPPT